MNKRMTFEEVKPGEWIQPVRRGYKTRCCDCGLVHDIDFRVKGGRAQLRVYRNKKLTKMSRMHFKYDDKLCVWSIVR